MKERPVDEAQHDGDTAAPATVVRPRILLFFDYA